MALEVNEEHAVAAAETLQHIAIPADKLGAVITAPRMRSSRLLARGKDAQMRNAFINTLGQIGDARAIPALTKVMLSEDYAQNLFNVCGREACGHRRRIDGAGAHHCALPFAGENLECA
ncbi:MAG: hypothetical protein R3A78_12205 [Polyangiales bacterium]